MYREEPIYRVVDRTGKVSKKDQELWEQIMSEARYATFMDKLDRWTRLLGTVLVKVSFVDPLTGNLVDKTEPGQIQLDMLHGGVYDIRHGASPYYITELLIGFGTKFDGFAGNASATNVTGGSVAGRVPSPSDLGPAGIEQQQRIKNPAQLGQVNRIYWSPRAHVVSDEEGSSYEIQNPYGIVPAVPFFDQDPAHYYFLPINEPLIYANHAVNMRLTDLNHIAKFQSFGIPVVKGVERPTSVRQGRPVDDFNQLKGGSALGQFGGLQNTSGFAAGGQFRTFDAGLSIVRDGNADANALGFSVGPDTAVAVGEKGDFKFAHPNADIQGLVKSIYAITDMVRINHGLRPKYEQSLPSSGFALLMEKIGVIEDNIRRSKLFKEREQQLFQVIKQLWNTHNSKTGDTKFSNDCKLEITYIQPEFPVDPRTKMETLLMEQKILDTGDLYSIKQCYPHMSETDIRSLVKKRRKDKLDQATAEAEIEIKVAAMRKEAGLEDTKSAPTPSKESEEDVAKPKIDNRAAHAENSSKQPGKNGDQRRK